MHTCKKSIIGRALARFFCGLLIGSEVGINAKWISTEANKIADEIEKRVAELEAMAQPKVSAGGKTKKAA